MTMTDKEIFDTVHEENLGVDVSKVDPRNTDPSQECNSVVAELTDQEIYDKKCESIKLDWDELNLKVGGVFRLSVSVIPSGANVPSLIWESSNPSVAIVTQDGIVTVVGSGSTKIIATNSQNTSIFAECTVTAIENGVASIEVSPSSSELVKNQTIELTATVSPEDADNKEVTWVSLNKPIATVDPDGVVTGVSVGEATIKAIATDGSKVEGICTITVTPIKVSSVTVESSKTLTKGETFTPTLTIEPEDADNKEVTWTSDHPEFASVDPVSGLVTGIAAGSAVITATAKDGSGQSGTCTVTVNSIKVSGITVDPTSKTIDKGANFKITATVSPEEAENKEVTWSSDHPEIASVNNGTVTGVAAGSAIITVTAADGSGQSATCNVTVNPKLVSGIVMNPTTKSITVDETFTPSITASPEDADNKEVTWASDHPEFASVDPVSGLVTGVAEGEAIITATAKDGSGQSATCTVTVTAATPAA